MILGPAQTVPFATTTTDLDLFTGAAILHGWGWQEPTNTTAAKFELTDGPGGPVILPVTLAINQSVRDWLAGAGIYARTGLSINMISGSLSGAVWIRPVQGDDPQLDLDVHGTLETLLEHLFQAAR